MKPMYDLSFRCYYGPGDHTTHHQTLRLSEIPKWVEAYKFTHPNVQSISIKIWFEEEKK